METKKTSKADLNNKRSLFLMTGMIIAIGIVIAAFSYSVPEIKLVYAPPLPPVEVPILPPVTQDDPKPDKAPNKITIMPLAFNIKENNAKIELELDDDVFRPDFVPTLKPVAVVEKPVDSHEIFIVVEDMPKFMGGGLDDFRKWVIGKLRYPTLAAENGIQGKVLLTFVIEKDGRLTGIEVLQSPDRSLTEEASRVLAASPVWTPGMQRKTPARVRFTMPVDFRLE